MEKFVTSSLNFYGLNDEGTFHINETVLARSVVSEFLHQKGDYNFGEL